MLRLGLVGFVAAVAIASAADGISPLASAADYPVHVTAGPTAIGASYVSPAQAKRLFGEDLDKKGFVVFEVGIFPGDGDQLDVAGDDFKLRQGKDPSVTRASNPQIVAAVSRPEKVHRPTPKLPANVTVYNTTEVGYEHGPYGRNGVYTGTGVGVGIGGNPTPAADPQPSTGSQTDLEQQLQLLALPAGKTRKPVAGYIFFNKPTGDKRAPYELIYFGLDGQVSLKLPVKQ